ncbi:NAD-dependent protein deacetylase [Kineosporiaceae bacterium SCSIO 59966]|nr:NAD-dependent protein deacetylase [Kineosporiaceae bacterium SCSIO 59966]
MATGLDGLVELVAGGGVLVLSGAGLSTDSGIPDYRGPTGSLRRASPMTFQEFTGSAAARRRYWARSHVGWRTIARARPNAGHDAVTRLQHRGLVDAVITQNVDGLHQAAGSSDVVELHGGLDRVVCLCCGDVTSRAGLDARLTVANPRFGADVERVNPDGDAEVPDEVLEDFVVVDCLRCGSGPLKPDVVFFGERVPPDRTARCFTLVDAARAVVVLGSSLTVMSGYRFVLHASRRGIPVAVVNRGPTRADDRADVRVDAPLGDVLPVLAARLAVPADRTA